MNTSVKLASIGVLCVSLMGPKGSLAGILVEDGVTIGGGPIVIGLNTYYPMTADWWQWALSYPSSTSPMFDQDGSRAHVGDRGSVFYLAGAFPGLPPYTRTFDVPFGKPLFFPVANNIGLQNLPTDTEASLRVLADTANIAEYQVSLDGTLITSQATRQKSPLFTLESPLLPEFDICYPAACPSSYTGMAVSDGFWVTLAPLSQGMHTINFGGTFVDDKGQESFVDITANINVVPEPATYALMFGGLGLVGWLAARRKLGR